RFVKGVESFVEIEERSPKLKLLGGPHRLEAGEGFLDCGVVREHPVQRRELEDDAHLLVGSGQAQLPLAAADLLEGGDHRAQSRRIDEADALHVDHDLVWAALEDRKSTRLNSSHVSI